MIKILCHIALYAYATAAWGFVLMKFYSWFAMPVFKELPALQYAQFVGLWWIVRLFNMYNATQKKGQEVYTEKSAVMVVISPAWYLLFGWLTYLIIR